MKKTTAVAALAAALYAAIAPVPAWAGADDGMFERGTISDDGAFGLTLSPDGQHALWVRSGGRREVLVVMESRKAGGKWQAPTVAPFSGRAGWKDIDPMFSPDGRTLIFQSNRPVDGKPARTGFDVWAVQMGAQGWGQPYHLGNLINTDESESSASIAANGNIYFMKNNPDGVSQSDLYLSRLAGGQYQVPENLGPALNTRERESNPYVAPDESYLIYFSSDPRGLGDVDLYISFRAADGWSVPRNLGAPINSAAAEFTPLVKDGRIYLARQVKQGERFIENIHSFPFDAERYRR